MELSSCEIKINVNLTSNCKILAKFRIITYVGPSTIILVLLQSSRGIFHKFHPFGKNFIREIFASHP